MSESVNWWRLYLFISSVQTRVKLIKLQGDPVVISDTK